MPSVDWAAAADALARAGKDQFLKFLGGPVAAQVYAVGFFLDPDAGDVFPISNTMDHHTREFAAHKAAGGDADQTTFLWDSGNWEYPAGLFPSASATYQAFDRAWGPHRDAVSQSDDPDRAQRLRDAGVEALRRIAADGVFARAENLMGYVVQGPADEPGELAANQERVTAAVTAGA